METIFNNTIKNTPNIQKYTFNNQQLLNHQNQLLTALYNREKNLRSGESYHGEMFFSKLGVIADPINTNLFQTLLAYIKHTKSNPHSHTTLMMHPFSTSQVFSIIPAHESNHNCNLLIVSNNFLATIRGLLENQEDINYIILKRQNQLNDELINTLNNTDLLIVPASQAINTLNLFSNSAYTFHRCFIQDSAALSTIAREMAPPRSEFTWILTEHWSRLIWPDLDFNDLESTLERTIRDILPNAPQTMEDYIQFEKMFSPTIGTRSLLYRYLIFHPLVHTLIVLSEPLMIAESMNIGAGTRTTLKYSYDEPLQIVHSILSSIVGNQLGRNDILGAITSVGAQILSPDIWSQDKAAYIRDEQDEESCPICYEKLTYPTVTECCRKLFCAQCILSSCRAGQSCICPMCRGQIHGNRLLVVAELPKKQDYLYDDKLTTLVKYVEQNQNRPTVVYFPFEPRLGRLKAKAKKLNITLEILNGSRYDSQKKINRFNNNGGTLIVTDIKQLHGYHLPSIAVLILYPDNTAPSVQRILRTHAYSLALPLEVVVFEEDAVLATAFAGATVLVGSNPGVAHTASGGVNRSLGDSSVATSHT